MKGVLSMKRKINSHILCIILIMVLCGCNDNSQSMNIGVDENNLLLKHFVETHQENEVIKCEQEDVNNDGTKDLVVIYKIGERKNEMTIVVDDDGNYEYSDPVSAPVENQTIRFKNIDEKGQIEIIVSGSKDGNVGYGIFRLEDMKIINLFAQDMEECC